MMALLSMEPVRRAVPSVAQETSMTSSLWPRRVVTLRQTGVPSDSGSDPTKLPLGRDEVAAVAADDDASLGCQRRISPPSAVLTRCPPVGDTLTQLMVLE